MPPQNKSCTYVLIITGLVVLALGVLLIFIPPALFPDPANGFQVLRSMKLGGAFNMLTAPDQDDISQSYSEFMTWWSPGQYLVPYFFNLTTHVNLGQAAAITVMLAQLIGLTGFYAFFKKAGFNPLIATLSILFIVCQLAFFVPYVFYNGGEVLLFAFEGWFLYGCIALKKTDWKLVLFALLSGWLGFFFKSSFIWMYCAGLCCLWVRLSTGCKGAVEWIKKGIPIAIPAAASLAVIYFLFLSKGQSPASVSKGLKLSAETFTFPLSTPILSGFSLDDFFHGLIYNFGRPMFSHPVAIAILIALSILSLVLILNIIRKVPNPDYRTFIIVFYFGALLFFGVIYLKQLNISYEARHFRIIGLLIVPGVIYLVSRLKSAYSLAFGVICVAIAYFSFAYVIKGFNINSKAARGITGFAQINVDQQALDTIVKLDREHRDATFVFVANDIGLEVQHNQVINLTPVPDDYKINIDDYRYDGFAGPLYIVLPETYNGPKEKLIMKSFPGYAGFNLSMLGDNYVLYSANMKRGMSAKR